MEKIKITYRDSEDGGDCHFDNYEDEKGNIYYCEYELVGWFTDDNKPVGDDVEFEIV